MNRFFAVIAIIIIPVLILSACCEKKVYCGSQKLDFAFTGFPRNDIRSFTLRRFAKGDQWGKPLDSALFIYYGNAPVRLTPDTIPMADYRTISKIDGITTGNDWGIFLPATGELYFITNIFDDNKVSTMARCNDHKTSCTRNIVNYSVNNEWKDGGYAYIAKKK